MFGESHSESPRLPSPWLSRSATGTSPSPLTLPSPGGSTSSNPSTPTDTTAAVTAGAVRARRRTSLEALELLEGLAEEFDAFVALGNGNGKHPTATGLEGRPFLVPELEQVAVREASAAGLQPEIDHQGNIEYKLKIAMPTSIHRLEKLRTQLKWRLVEGGGTAVYELGLLDNGTLVGLNQEEMEQSLKTLAQMLAGLGGGRIQISRVIQIGLESESPHMPPPIRPLARTADPACPSPTSTIFPSFDVLADNDDISFVASGTPPVVDSVTGETSIFPPPRIRGPTPFPANRSEEQQAAFRRDKRDARRARRREAELAVAASSRAGSRSSFSSSLSSSLESSRASTPASSDTPSTPPIMIPPRSFQTSYPVAIEPRTKPPKPPKPPRPTTARLRKEVESAAGMAAAENSTTTVARAASIATSAPQQPVPVATFKPILPQDCDEVRYVVEAIVHKAGYASALSVGRRRRKSSSGSRRSDDPGGEASCGLQFDQLQVGSLGSTISGTDHDGSGGTGSGAQEAGYEDEDDADSDADGSLFEGDEGWNYLEFDLSAAAAAATAAHAASLTRSSVAS
ncbi:hypothetical protein JCM10908_001263 [Rhodotorula pacifica]|uniref:uncharacterized protein n=1 Tax=Rhodotorula pacifica TaxID=1495444 RepID=UPI00316F4250